jgi:hypothetical protein
MFQKKRELFCLAGTQAGEVAGVVLQSLLPIAV